MKTMKRFVGVVAVGVSLLVAPTVFAQHGFAGGHGGGGHGGFHGGYGWGWGIGLGFGWPYYSYPASYYYDYPPTYYYAPAPMVYSTQPQVVYSSPTVDYYTSQPVVNNPPPANYTAQPITQAQAPTPASSVQQQPMPPNNQKLPMTVADIKALAKGGLSDDIILSQVRSQHAVFHLTTFEIIDLKTGGVSEKVIDYMINTASQK